MPDEEQSGEGFTVRDRRRFLVEDDADTSETSKANANTATPAPDPETPDTAPIAADDEGDNNSSSGNNSGAALFGDPGDADEMMAAGIEDEDSGALPDVYSVLALFLGELRNLAWLRMGLVANPATGQVERDMAQAKVAIDTVVFLAQQLEQIVAPDERIPLRALVSDLQVNFVEQSKRGA